MRGASWLPEPKNAVSRCPGVQIAQQTVFCALQSGAGVKSRKSLSSFRNERRSIDSIDRAPEYRQFRELGSLLSAKLERISIAPSSNGKTADSGSAYRGSNPCGAALRPANQWFLRPYRLTVRTEPSQGSNTGSIPVKATRRRNSDTSLRPARFRRVFFRFSISALHAPVAQLDRASDYGSEGWGFKSLRVHLLISNSSDFPGIWSWRERQSREDGR